MRFCRLHASLAASNTARHRVTGGSGFWRRSMKRIVVVSVSGVLAVAVGVFGTRIYERRSHPTAHTDQSAAANADLEALRQEIASLRASQRVLAEATWSRLTAAPAPVEPAPAAAPSPPTPAQHGSESARRPRRDPIRSCRHSSARIPIPGGPPKPGRRWSRSSAARIFPGCTWTPNAKRPFAAWPSRSILPAETERFVPLMGASIPWEGTASGTFDPETHRGVYYFSRPGHVLPLPPVTGSAAAN